MVAIWRYMVSNCCGARVIVASFLQQPYLHAAIVLLSVNDLQRVTLLPSCLAEGIASHEGTPLAQRRHKGTAELAWFPGAGMSTQQRAEPSIPVMLRPDR